MPILIVADDLTGAAEISGMALRFGLSVEIVHALEDPTQKEVRVLNTNTRSLDVEAAMAHLQQLFLADSKCFSSETWDWIYLKFDSALRGHIPEEIAFYRQVFKKDKVVFCPVNLALGRVIRDGVYLVDGKPIAETDFAQDPEFPIHSSVVQEVLGGADWRLLEQPNKLSETYQACIIAEVDDETGLNEWASTGVAEGIYAGAAAFFEAILRYRKKERPQIWGDSPLPQPPVLYVCGSNHQNSQQRLATIDDKNIVYWRRVGDEEALAQELVGKAARQGRVVLAIAPTVPTEPRAIRLSMAQVVARVQQGKAPCELLIEGGATARAVLEALAIDTLIPVWEYGQGVIRNRVPGGGWEVTLKPGSYPWADGLWPF